MIFFFLPGREGFDLSGDASGQEVGPFRSMEVPPLTLKMKVATNPSASFKSNFG